MAFISSLEMWGVREGMEECGEAAFFIIPGSDMMDWVRLERMSLVLELARIWDCDMKLVMSTSLELETQTML